MIEHATSTATAELAKPVEAKYVLNSSAPSYSTAGELYAYEVEGLLHLKWSLSPRYVIRKYRSENGQLDKERSGFAVTVFGKDGAPKFTDRSTLRSGELNTKLPWGTGWSAQIAFWNDYPEAEAGWIVVLLTPQTQL